MDVRALLFTADGGSSATLCQVLTELGIEAEICPEMLVAAGRLARESYGALIVDWSNETEAAFLLKTARDKKSQSLNIALVSDEPSVARALQQGANSVIRKPIDAAEAHDTLSTARDLIQSRRTEQRDKEARVAAALAPPADTEEPPEMPVQEAPAVKTGFLAQSMSRSAFEAEEKIVKPEYTAPTAPTGFQVARGPASIQEEQETEPTPAEPVSKKRWDDVRAVFRETPQEPAVASAKPAGSQDATGVFSSLRDYAEAAEEPFSEIERSSTPPYLVFAVVACLLGAGVLYVWAPGGSYLGRITSILHRLTAKTASVQEQPQPTQPVSQAATPEKPAAPAPPAGTEEFAGETGPIPSTEVDPNNIQIIETKAIPKAGAQQPPSKDPAPDTNSSQSPIAAQSSAPVAAGPSRPTDEQPTASQEPVTVPDPTVPRPSPVPASVPQDASPLESRVGVVIPDSLKSSPSMAPASSLEPPAVPEETSLGLLIHKVDPVYPAQAQQQQLDGPVVLQAWIAKDGSVRDVKLVKGYFILARAASDAVKQWRFKPYSPHGKAVDFQTMLTVNFKRAN